MIWFQAATVHPAIRGALAAPSMGTQASPSRSNRRDNYLMRARTVVFWLGGVALGCSPQYDWREVRIPDAGVKLMFPCKPQSEARRVVVAAGEVVWTTHACRAGGLTFAFGSADLPQPPRVELGLEQLSDAAARKLGGRVTADNAFSVSGATPGQARRIESVGPFTEGALDGRVILFARGSRIHQATVFGPQPAADVIETYFDSIRAGP